MWADFFNNESRGKIEGFSIAAGVVAALTALYRTFHLWQHIRLLNEFNLPVHMTAFISPVATIAAMIVFAVYVFVFYGRQQSPLMGISAAIVAGWHFYFIYIFISVPHTNSSIHILNMIRVILTSAIFVVIALKYLTNKVNFNIKVLPVVALAMATIMPVMSSVILGFRLSVTNFLLTSSHFVPFVLFILFCPQTYQKVSQKVNKSVIVTGDLNSQLLYFKTEFESGRISQQEYDLKRKNLMDKL